MPNTRNFGEVIDKARKDPERARRIDEAKQRALDEVAAYRLAELCKALGVTEAELTEVVDKSLPAISETENGAALSLDVLRSVITQLGGEMEITAVFDDRRVLIDA